MTIRNQEDAAAYVSHLDGQIPDGYYVTATCMVDLGFILSYDACLWSVAFTSDDEGKWVGLDLPIESQLLRARNRGDGQTDLYIGGVADLVDPDVLAERLKVITMKMNEAIWALADAARRGYLRQLPQEHHPNTWT